MGFVLSWLPLHSKYLIVSVYLAITMLLIWLSLLSITYHSDENKNIKQHLSIKSTFKTCDTHLRMTLLFLNHAILYYFDELEHHLS